jgi:MFS family permease
VILRSVPKQEMVAAMSWLTMPAMLGPVVGPPLGGFIVTWFSWRWIFDINVPIGVLGIVLVSLFIEDSESPPPSPFDFFGLLWSGLCLASLLVGFETLGRGIVPPVWTYTFLTLGVGSGVAYWLHARGMAKPLLDLKLLREKTFSVGCSAGTLFRFGVGALPFLLPMMLQLDFGYSPERSGMTTFATAAGSLLIKPMATAVLRRFGFRDTLIWNGLLASLSMAACAAFRPDWPVWVMFLILLVGGTFRSLQFSAFNTVVYADVPRPRLSSATSLYSTVQQLSMTVGITVGAASLEVARAISHHEVPTLDDFSAAFLVVSFLALLASPIAAIIPPDAGAEMTGHKAQATGRIQEVEAAGE